MVLKEPTEGTTGVYRSIALSRSLLAEVDQASLTCVGDTSASATAQMGLLQVSTPKLVASAPTRAATAIRALAKAMPATYAFPNH